MAGTAISSTMFLIETPLENSLGTPMTLMEGLTFTPRVGSAESSKPREKCP